MRLYRAPLPDRHSGTHHAIPHAEQSNTHKLRNTPGSRHVGVALGVLDSVTPRPRGTAATAYTAAKPYKVCKTRMQRHASAISLCTPACATLQAAVLGWKSNEDAVVGLGPGNQTGKNTASEEARCGGCAHSKTTRATTCHLSLYLCAT